MARPVRIDVKNGWYHITARGIERRSIFTHDHECRHFVELVGEMTERYGVEVHAFVLMGNHYHLLIRTPGANASTAIQWLNVSYSVWFNRRHERVGHVFQGRFGSQLVDGDGSWLLLASAYLHLNPVRVGRLGLSKQGRQAEGQGLKVADQATVERRLKTLREYVWSSYGSYAEYRRGPEWLVRDEILKREGGAGRYRRWVESYVKQGGREDEFEGLKTRVMVGSTVFLERMKRLIKSLSEEQPDRKYVRNVVPFERIVKVVAREKGEDWSEFADRHGDWGRDLAFYLARKRSGLTLRDLGEAAGGVAYKTVAKAIQRMESRLVRDRKLKVVTLRCLGQLSNVET